VTLNGVLAAVAGIGVVMFLVGLFGMWLDDGGNE
jgi:hypothetical protein